MDFPRAARWQRVTEVPLMVAAVAFLASDDARYCTAHNYWVDAGWR